LKRGAMLALTLISLILGGITVSGENSRGAWSRIYEAYGIVERLGAGGMNVSGIIGLLNKAIVEAERGNETGASILAGRALSEARGMEADYHSYRTKRMIGIYGSVAALLAVPVVFYLAFPRIYYELWFRARRRWRVED